MLLTNTDIPNPQRCESINADLVFIRLQLLKVLEEHCDSQELFEFVDMHNRHVRNTAFELELPEVRYELECTVSIDISTSTSTDELERTFREALESAAEDVEYCSVSVGVDIIER